MLSHSSTIVDGSEGGSYSDGQRSMLARRADYHYLHLILEQEEMKESALAEAAQAVLQRKRP
jgi:hypothetical protein